MVNREDDSAARYYRQGQTVAEIATLQKRTQDQVRDSLERVSEARRRAQEPGQ